MKTETGQNGSKKNKDLLHYRSTINGNNNWRTMARHNLTLLFLLALLAILSLVAGLSLGNTTLSLPQIVSNSFKHQPSLDTDILLRLRLPRVITAFCCGGVLALAGALLQVLLRNPLADPYILGVSGGAATASLLTLLTGLGAYWLPFTTFLGSLISMGLVFGLTVRANQWSSDRLLLSGVMLASLWGALIGFLLNFSDNIVLRNMWFWMMGDLSHSQNFTLILATFFIGLLLSMSFGRSLNLLALGDIKAQTLGVNRRRLQWQLYFLSALLTAACVTAAGPIGFIGLLTPHILRLLHVRDYQFLLPAAALLGGSLLTIADTLSRLLIAPAQLPVGIITTLIGAPLFLFLLQRKSAT